jgi:phenylalanyl-tRNA synthetase alpha subunit
MYFMCEYVVGTSQTTRIFSSTKSSPVMSYREVIDVYRNNRVDHTHTTCGQNTEFLNVTSSGTYNDLWALKGKYRNVISDSIEIFAINTFPISAVSDMISNCSVVSSCDMAM